MVLILLRYTLRVLKQIQNYEKKYGDAEKKAYSRSLDIKVSVIFAMYIQFLLWCMARDVMLIYSDSLQDFVKI